MTKLDAKDQLVLLEMAKALKLNGLVEHWGEIGGEEWVGSVVLWEREERASRSMQQRTLKAKIPHFKTLADFDWHWPEKIERSAIEGLMTCQFIAEKSNVVLMGGNGLGKTTLACNLAYQGLLAGYTVLFRTANQLLGDLAAMSSDRELRQRMTHYASPSLLVIDEIGYHSYSDRYADMLFELISRRYEHRSTIVTTNLPFGEWGKVFPNAACVYSMIDRLVHYSEVITIEGSSYRLREAQDRARVRDQKRQGKGEAATKAPTAGKAPATGKNAATGKASKD